MAGPTVTATILAVDSASQTLRSVAAEAEAIQNRVGRGQRGMTAQMVAAHADHAKAQKDFVAAQKEHLAAIERANSGLVQMRDLLKGIALYKLGSIGFEGLKQGDAMLREVNRARAAGLSDDEIEKLDNRAAEISTKVLGLHQSEIFKMGTEMRGMLLHPEEMPDLLPTIAAARQIIDRSSAHHGENLAPVLKALEDLNVTNNPKVFESTMLSLARAFQVFSGGQLRADTFNAAVKAAGAPSLFWSPEFRDRYFPTLVQAYGDTAGVRLNQFSKEFLGGFQNMHGALKQAIELGLVAKSDVDVTKTGEAKALKPGAHVQDYKLATENPFQWVDTVLRPALEKRGITKPEDVLSAIRQLAPNKNVSAFLVDALEKAANWRKDAENIGNAQGDKAVNPSDWSFAGPALKTAITDAIGAGMSPIMEPTARMANELSGYISAGKVGLEQFYKNSPNAAPWIAGGAAAAGGVALWQGGGLIKGLLDKLTGFGSIKAAGLELSASAAALDRAALSLSAAGKAGVGGAVAQAEGAAMAGGAVSGRSLVAALGTAALGTLPAALLAGSAIGAVNDAIDGATSADPKKYADPNASADAIKAELEKANADTVKLAAAASKGEIGRAFVKFAELQSQDIQRYLGEHYQRQLLGWLQDAGYEPRAGATVRAEMDRENARARALGSLSEGLHGVDNSLKGLDKTLKKTFDIHETGDDGKVTTRRFDTPKEALDYIFETGRKNAEGDASRQLARAAEMDREARRAYALSNLPPLAYTANEADFEARRGHAHSAPWQPETANSAAANAGPIKVDVASTVTGTVDGKAELAIHLTADSLLGGLSKMISSAINLSGGIRSDFGFAHGNQGESAHVPSPASSGHFGHN